MTPDALLKKLRDYLLRPRERVEHLATRGTLAQLAEAAASFHAADAAVRAAEDMLAAARNSTGG